MPTDRSRQPESLTPFERVAGDPKAWQETAHDLVGSANIILETLRNRKELDWHIGFGGPAFWRTPMMLYGLASENLIKAIIVAKKPVSNLTFPLSKGSFPGWFKKHDLTALAKCAGLWVSQSQQHLLNRLKVFVECGKYPVGLREGQDDSTQFFSEEYEWNDVFQLLDHLEEELQKASGGHVSAHPDLRGIHMVRP